MWAANVGGAVRTGMTDLRDDYQGYCINITRYAGRWRATIYGPDSKQPMLGPQSDDPTEAVDKANDGLRCPDRSALGIDVSLPQANVEVRPV